MFGIKDADLQKVIEEYKEIKGKIDFIYYVLKGYYVNHKDEIDSGLQRLKEEAEKEQKDDSNGWENTWQFR